MKRIFAIALLAAPAFGQTLTVDQVDQALSTSRATANNEIMVKDQRIAGLAKQLQDVQAEVDKLKKAAAKCKPAETQKK